MSEIQDASAAASEMIGEFEPNGFTSTADGANDKPDAVMVGYESTLVYSRLCRAAW